MKGQPPLPEGFAIGHWSDPKGQTGCTVVIPPPGTRGGVWVQGGGPGTRQTDTLAPLSRSEEANAVLLTGGSAFGLAAADGVARWLEEHERGHWTPVGLVPLVPSAVIFDLASGDPKARPGPEEGYAACEAASSGVPERGGVGVGTGATVAKTLGREGASAGGFGYAAVRTGAGETVAALAAANSAGDVIDEDGSVLAGPRDESGEMVRGAELMVAMEQPPEFKVPEGNTILVCICTDAPFEADGFPQHQRAEILDRAAHIVAEREDDLAATIAAEAGKPIKTARVEAQRCVGTLTFSAVEARKLTGEMVPMEAGPAGEGKLGFVIRVPYGVVGAISPFNFPLNLVAHKLGPAIAAGNAVVLKPAGQTPISAIKLAEILYEAGLPENWLQVVCGSGSEVGNAIVENEDIGAITFTGSAPVGWEIRAKAARKQVNLELGSTAPLIVHEDGDWEDAADKAKIHAFSHAGQSCISVQRILLHESIADDFSKRFVSKVESLVVGDPMDEHTDVGPLISPDDRDRVKQWVDEAAKAGGEVLTGGELVDEDRCLAPTVLREPPKEAKVWCEEIFGPVATLHSFRSFDEAIELANDAKYGLQAGVYTRDLGRAIDAGQRLEFGGVLVNEVPTFRTDQMPYGGVKDSGNTREGPAYAVRELTEERLVTLQG